MIRLSYSTIRSWAQCPRALQLGRQDDVGSSPARELGRLIHAEAEASGRGADPDGISPATTALREAGLIATEDDGWELEVELGARGRLQGRADALRHRDGVIEILDYKTTARFEETRRSIEETIAWSPQWLCYASMAARPTDLVAVLVAVLVETKAPFRSERIEAIAPIDRAHQVRADWEAHAAVLRQAVELTGQDPWPLAESRATCRAYGGCQHLKTGLCPGV